MRASKYGKNLAGTDQENRVGGGGGKAGINVRSCYTSSSNEFEDAQDQAPTQVPNHDKFFDAQTTLWPSDIAVNQRAPGQLQLDDCIYPSPWGSLKSSLSQRMSVRWHARELTVKWRQEPIMGSWWRSTDRLLFPMCTYCVLGYLLLDPH